MQTHTTEPTKYVHIYTEANPNPNSMKFVANFLLVREGTDHFYANAESAAESPLAQALFQFPYVKSVFIMNNFVTVTKDEQSEWEEIKPEIKHFLTQYFEQEKPIMNLPDISAAALNDENLTETERKIVSILDEYIRPAVEGDGGAINFKSFENGVVKVELRGSCSGCPSSAVTLKAGIQNLLTRMIPEVKEVIAENM